MASSPILANRRQYSWGSIILRFANGQIELEGYTEITWGQKRPRSKGYGQGRHQAPQVRSRGKYEVDNVKIKMRVDHADALRLGLAQIAGGTSYGDTAIYIQMQLDESPNPISTTEFFDAVVTGESGAFTEGPDGLLEEIEFDIMAARRNGLALFDDSDPNTPY